MKINDSRNNPKEFFKDGVNLGQQMGQSVNQHFWHGFKLTAELKGNKMGLC